MDDMQAADGLTLTMCLLIGPHSLLVLAALAVNERVPTSCRQAVTATKLGTAAAAEFGCGI